MATAAALALLNYARHGGTSGPRGAAIVLRSRPLLYELRPRLRPEWNPELNPEEPGAGSCQAVFVFFKLLHWESDAS